MNEQTEIIASNKVACPYYGGLKKDCKKIFIICGNNLLPYIYPTLMPESLYKNDKCLGLAGSDRYNCRAFLTQSIKDKKINVGSNLCIPELQEIYDNIKYRPEQNESEDNNMQEKTNASTATGDADLHVITPSAELTDATQLHQRIMAGIEVAANALIDVCRNIKTMRDKKLYTQLGYESFEDYAEQAVGMKRRQAYNYIQVLEKLPSSTLQDNAHIGITKLELLSQVPALDREGFLEENNVDGMSVREMEDLVKTIKDQGEQLSMLGSENERLKDENTNLQSAKQELDAVSSLEDELTAQLNEKDAELDNVRNELAQVRVRAKELEDRPVDVAVQEPDEETLEKIRAEARAAAEVEAADKIKKAESAAKTEADEKIKKIQSEQDTRVKEAREQAAKDAAAKLQKSLDAAETDKSETLKRTIELEKQLKIAGDPDAVLMQHYFNEIQRSFSQITEIIEKKQDKEPDFAKKYTGALSRALDALKEQLAGQTSFDNGGVLKKMNDNQKTDCAVDCTKQTPEPLSIHNLKTWAEPFDAMTAGLKTWEFRKNDRGYKVGDFLHLMRYDPVYAEYTGQALDMEVIFMLHGGVFGIPEDYVIMSVVPVNDKNNQENLKMQVDLLQAELEAAIDDITVCCDTCACDILDTHCHYEVNGECANWQWRGSDAAAKDKRKCRVCGCTQYNACLGGCYWVEDDLCSECAGTTIGTALAGGVQS